jgi:cytochrome c
MLPRSFRRRATVGSQGLRRLLGAGVLAVLGLMLGAAALNRPRRVRQSPLLDQSAGSRAPTGWAAPIAILIGVMVLGAITTAYVSYQSQQQQKAVARELTLGEPDRAPVLMVRYGCAGCHTIPGVRSAIGRVGPALTGFSGRVYIGGASINTPDRLIEWLVDPHRIDPKSAMPATGISNAEARDVAAYLYTLR